MPTASAPLNGRRAEAARNDERILESARAVFIADPGAPISAVAKHAGVGISALYRRFESKEALLRQLAATSLNRYIETVEAALADSGDPWQVFVDFTHRVIDTDTQSLAHRLAGTFTPTPELYAAAQRGQNLNIALFDRTMNAGVLRPDLTVGDIGLILEMVMTVRLSRPRAHPTAAAPLPGPAARSHAQHRGRPAYRSATDVGRNGRALGKQRALSAN